MPVMPNRLSLQDSYLGHDRLAFRIMSAAARQAAEPVTADVVEQVDDDAAGLHVLVHRAWKKTHSRDRNFQKGKRRGEHNTANNSNVSSDSQFHKKQSHSNHSLNVGVLKVAEQWRGANPA